MSSQRLIACQEGDKLKMDISHMKKLLIATALLSVSAGSMAANPVTDSVTFSASLPTVCSIDSSSTDLAFGETVTFQAKKDGTANAGASFSLAAPVLSGVDMTNIDVEAKDGDDSLKVEDDGSVGNAALSGDSLSLKVGWKAGKEVTGKAVSAKYTVSVTCK